MSLFEQDGRLREGLEIASRYIAKLEAIVDNQRSEIALLKAQLQGEVRRRRSAELRVAELEDAAAEQPDEQELRDSVLRLQALRARLAKNDMSAAARGRTLEAALRAGLQLTQEQLLELRAFRRGDEQV